MLRNCPASCAEEILIDTAATAKDCKDVIPKCAVWAELGECDNNEEMRSYCAKSCNTCGEAVEVDSLCKDEHENCRFWADAGECKNNPTVSPENAG